MNQDLSATHADHTETVRAAISTNVMVTIIARVVYLLTRFFVPPFVLARVTMEAYGLWATAFILVSYIGISTMGLSSVYSKYVAQFSSRGEYQRANELLSTGLAVAIPFCGALFGVICWFWPWVLGHLRISSSLTADARIVVLIVVGSFLLSLCTSAFSDALTGVQKEAANQGIWIVAYLVETALIFLLVGLGNGVRGLAEAFLLRTLLEEGLATIVAFRKIRWLRISPTLVNRESLHIILSFGGVVQLAGFFSIALNSIERVLAAPLIGLQASGLLDIGKKLPSMAASIPNAFTNSLAPAASYLQGGLGGSEESRATLHKLFLKGARYMNVAAAYFCALLAVASTPILFVWLGKRYDGAAVLATVFAVGTQVHLMTGPGTSVLKGLGRPKEEFYYCIPNVVALTLFIPLSRLVFGAWTAIGIGSAVALSTIVSAAFFIRHANRILGLVFARYWRRVALPGVVPYLVALPLAIPITIAVNQTTRWRGAIWLVLLGAVYTAVLAVVVDRWVMDEGERLWLRAMVRSRLPKLPRVRNPRTGGHTNMVGNHIGNPRCQMIAELSGRYGHPAGGRAALWRFYWKKHAWRFLVGGARALKRGIDIAAAISALVVLCPLFAVVALVIKLTDGGPVFFWQTRVGQWGSEFPFPKFRSMVVNAEALKAALTSQSHHEESVTFKMRNDPRVTAIGRIIRKLSIDELPQLWCVLKGDMSLVGPRPPLPKEVALYTLADRRRLDVKPGLTCTWQVSGRGDIPFDKQVQLDLQYIESQSVWRDVKLLLKTVPAVLLGKGAY